MTAPEPIQVTVCLGPNCSAFGGRAIQAAVRELARRYRGLIELDERPCFARCQRGRAGLLPSVNINGEWQTDANPRSVRRKLAAMLEGGEGGTWAT